MELAKAVQLEIDGLIQTNRSVETETSANNEKFQEWRSSLDPSLDPPKKRQQTMSNAKLNQYVLQGLGTGHGASYQPWLTLRRKNPSKTSNQVAAYLFPLFRAGYFFSRGEYQIALLLLWLGVVDLREQYPIWPFAHPYPLFGAPGTEGMKTQYFEGLLKIAHDAGIDHGVYPGTRIPYVATLDFLLTVRIANELRMVAISCKPFDDPDCDIKWRVRERLELEHRYAERNGIVYHIVSSRLVPILMAGQLEWCIECANLEDAPHIIPTVTRFATEYESMPDLSISDAVHRASEICELQLADGWMAFRHCVWTQKIDLDLSQPILTSYPGKRGGRDLRKQLSRALNLGGSE